MFAPPRRCTHLGLAAAAWWLLVACGEAGEPPGRSVFSLQDAGALPLPTATVTQAPEQDKSDFVPGKGDKLLSIAMRSWVYMQPSDRATKLGYLRAGAGVERSRQAVGMEGCAGGWYRVAPRGFMCVGKGATLDMDHPVGQAVMGGPKRGQGMPYRYVISREPGPHLYFKLPSLDEQRDAEGQRRKRNIARYAGQARKRLGKPDEVPAFLLTGQKMPVVYGADKPPAYAVHYGRASSDSAFGLLTNFEWTERRMGLTSELDIIALDYTTVAPTSSMHGIKINEPGTPAFVIHHGVKTYQRNDKGRLVVHGDAPYRSGWVLTGKNNGSATSMVETSAGVWLQHTHLRVAKLREDGAGFARDGRRWIDVSIRRQMLVAYDGKKPVFATLVSTGRGEMRDPEKTHATVRGSFMIHSKHIAATMDGDDEASESFDLRDVPYIQYFYKGYALHGAYWHDDFGKVRSHGCINLAPVDAAWLFEWTDPQVPPGWHGALNREAGTLVYIHG